MARAVMTITSMPAKYPTLPISANGLDVAFTAAGASFALGHEYAITGKEILIVRNGNVGAQTVTITSCADPYNRTGNITTYSIGVGEYAIFPQFQLTGWQQADGYLWVDFSAADEEYIVLRLTD